MARPAELLWQHTPGDACWQSSSRSQWRSGFTSMQLGIAQERGAMLILGLALLQFLLIAAPSSWRPCSPMNTGSDGTAIYGRSERVRLLQRGAIPCAPSVLASARYRVAASRAALPAAVLIHGVACNRALWRPMIAHLRAAGFAPVRTLDSEPLFPDIDHITAGSSAKLLRLQRCSPARG